jgi:hypothetical protein
MFDDRWKNLLKASMHELTDVFVAYQTCLYPSFRSKILPQFHLQNHNQAQEKLSPCNYVIHWNLLSTHPYVAALYLGKN